MTSKLSITFEGDTIREVMTHAMAWWDAQEAELIDYAAKGSVQLKVKATQEPDQPVKAPASF